MRRHLTTIFIGLLFLTSFIYADTFNSDSSYAYIKHLSVTIGPRLLGSDSEHKALKWTVDQFARFGADSSYIMTFTTARSDREETFNTRSGNAIGVFKGETDSSIVIGGHLDSSGRDIPGANDNASGAATVIELARIWSQRSRHYTMIFIGFGGEESGLLGSKHFVNSYQKINNVQLMFSLDMTGCDDDIAINFETNLSQGPKWLVKDAFSIGKTLGITNLTYPTHEETLNTLSTQGSGSDHKSFLNKGIPAMSFTAGINKSPIHTPQDKIDFISKTVLAKYGAYTDKLLQKYQKQGIPTTSNARFMLVQILGIRLYLPHWFIAAFNIVAVLIGILAFMISRKNRLRIEKKKRIRFSGSKLLVMVVLVFISTQFGKGLMQFLKELRNPYMVHVTEYLWFGILWGVAGFWLTLQLTRKWRFSPDPYVYAKRTLIPFMLFCIGAAILSMRLAVYPALTLFFISLSILITKRLPKYFFAIITPVPMLKLMFIEPFTFLVRGSSYLGFAIDSFGKALLLYVSIVLIFVIWYFSFIYFFSYLLTTDHSIKKGVKFLRKPVWGVLISICILGFGVYLFTLPAYNELWKPAISVKAKYHIQKEENKFEIKSNEYFKDVSVKSDSLDEKYTAHIHKLELPIEFKADWMDVAGNTLKKSGERDTITVDWQITSSQPWYKVSLQIRPDTLKIDDISSELAFDEKSNRLNFVWFADPPEKLDIEANFTVYPGAKLIRKVTALYPHLPVDLQVTSDLANVRYRTEVTFQDTMQIK